MKFEFRLRNGEVHEFALPDAAGIRKAIVWVPKSNCEKKKEVANFIILPDDVDHAEVIDDD